jgi:ParB family chromosome partitioning protein
MSGIMEFFEAIAVKEIEIAHLNLRYAHTRIHRPEAVLLLAGSLERFGQLTPVISLSRSPVSYILLDGYLRVAALKRCGKDTVISELWSCDEKQALVQVLRRGQDRPWAPLEEAGVIRELIERWGLSQADIGHMLGKTASWVSRRLSLLESLSEEILQLVRTGTISVWSATRVLAPMARANADHARRLTEALVKEPLSTRQLAEFFRHYGKANRKTRDKMAQAPQLFIKALKAKEQDSQCRDLKDGPEGRWLRDLKVVIHIVRRLIEQAPTVLYAGQSRFERRLLLTAFEEADQLMASFKRHIRRLDHEDNARDHRGHLGFAAQANRGSANQPVAEDLQEHGSPSTPATQQGDGKKRQRLRGEHPRGSRVVCALQGQCGQGPGDPAR